jgi:hypothetical protein
MEEIDGVPSTPLPLILKQPELDSYCDSTKRNGYGATLDLELPETFTVESGVTLGPEYPPD